MEFNSDKCKGLHFGKQSMAEFAHLMLGTWDAYRSGGGRHKENRMVKKVLEGRS